MLKIVLVDDELSVQQSLKRLLELYLPGAQAVAACGTIEDAVQNIKELKPDVVLLDIGLAGQSGFDLFNHFIHPPFKVIFVTAHREHAIEAFRFAAVDYILKPVNPLHLQEALERATKALDNEKLNLKLESLIHNLNIKTGESKKIVLKTVEQMHVLLIKDIVYCQADRNYTNFHLKDKSRIMVSHGIADYEDMLEPSGFMRVHHSYLVNLEAVKRFEKTDGGHLVLTDGSSIPVATRRKDALLLKLNNI